MCYLPWEESEEFIRSGHRDPSEFKPDSLRTIWISEKEGIKAVIGKPKDKTTTEVVSYLFLKEKGWNLEKAKAWFQDHEQKSSHEHLYCLTPILEKIVDKPLRIRGIALTAGVSRNLNVYVDEELERFASKLIGSPVYLEHVSAVSAVGKVVDAKWDSDSKTLFYEAEIYDDETQEKIRKGLIQHVSVAADYEQVDSLDGKVPYGLHNAELSLVAVPGVPQTNVQIMEKLAPKPMSDEVISSVEKEMDDLHKALETLVKRVEALEKGRVEEAKKRPPIGRAIIALEAMETPASLDFSKIPLRDVMKHLS